MPTTSGWWTAGTAAFLLGSYLILGYPILLAVGVALAVALILGFILVMRRPDVAAFQTLTPALVGEGESANATITTTNRGRRTTPTLRATDRIGDAPHEVVLPALAPGQTERTQLRLPTDRRGVFEVGPLQIQRVDPLGLVATTTHEGSAVHLTVHPSVHPMAPMPTGARREREGSADQPQEGGISFHSLREYVPGDDLRLVHWRSVARTNGTLMVRKNVVTSEPRQMVLLDTSSESYHGDSFEDAVRIAASLVVSAVEGNSPVMFRTTGGLQADATASGEGKLGILTMLAQVTPTSDDPGLNAVLRFAERVEGVSLGAITGQPVAASTVGITASRPRFDMVTVVQVGESFDRPPMSIPGALVINGTTSEDVVRRWRGRFG